MRTEINDTTNLPAIVAIRDAYPDGLTLDGTSEDLGLNGPTVVFTYDERDAKYRMLTGTKVREIDHRDLNSFLHDAALLTVQELHERALLCSKFRTFQRRALDPDNRNAANFRKLAEKAAFDLRAKYYLTRNVDGIK